MGSRLESNSDAVRKRIASHTFDDEDGEEYEGSAFGGFSDYFRRKKLKLQNLDADIRSQSSDKPAIFKGVVAHVNGYTQPSLNDLHKLIVQHGGGFQQYLDGKTTVTHIIASNLTPKKATEFRRYRIVKPAWVVESIAAGKLLPWNDYRVLDEGENQKVLAFGNGNVVSKANTKTRGYRDQTESSWYTNQLRGTPSETPAGTPSSAIRSRFSRPTLPSPSSNNSMLEPEEESMSQSKAVITPSKTSPYLGPQKNSPQPSGADGVVKDHNDLHADPPLPNMPHVTAQSIELEKNSRANTDPDVIQHPPKRALTAEEHNAILLRDPKVRKSTVVDPNFLEQYYRESRLHHLSTWKADLKSQLQALAYQKTSSQKSKQKRPLGARRYVLHVDFDSFFAAVSLKNNPQWKDKPAVVAHGSGSGSEIASCNYPARKFGIKNGMWMKRAQELCPELKVLSYDFPAYEETSRAFYDAILATDGIVQSVSIDEALVDVSTRCIAAGGSDGKAMSEGSIYREQGKADEIAQSLRDQVKEKTDCNVSIGIGGNILLAKVALRKAKPAGQYQMKPDEALDFIGALQVQDLPGVAWSIGGKLEEVGIKFVKDIRECTKERLVQTLGPKTGEKLWEYSRGIDKTEVGEQIVRKSVSAEVNWGVRFENQEQADAFIGSLCGELQKRLLKEKVKGRQLTMKVMRRSSDAPMDPPKHLGHGKCDTYNKSLILGVATNSKEVLTKESLSILRGFGFSPGELRGIGIQMTKLEPMKSATDGSLEGSQRRLQFKVNTAERPTSVRKQTRVADVDPIQDDPETPKKLKHTPTEHVAFGAQELNVSTPSRRPLNTLGTQFILPTPFDLKVVSELPEDIRSKLLRQPRATSPTPIPLEQQEQDPSTPSKHSRTTNFPLTALPAHSQLDPEILAALPPDVRAEVLSQYAAGATPTSPSPSPHRRHGADQTVLPQSPRRNRIIGIPAKKPIVPPVKRGRGRPPRSAQLAAAAAATAKSQSGKTLRQASFFFSTKNPTREEERDENKHKDVPAQKPQAPAESGSGDADTKPDASALPEPPDPAFLDALPADVREEILQNYKRDKLQAANLDMSKPKDPFAPAVELVPEPPQAIQVPRPRIPTFSAHKLSKADDLRDAVKQWVVEFKHEGPYPEDADALARYLGKVVREERDLAKAVGVVKWLVWLVEEGSDEEVEDRSRGLWNKVVETVKKCVRQATKDRGLGIVSFD